MFQCIAVANIKGGYLDMVLEAAEKLAIATRGEIGNIDYNVLRSINRDNTLVFFEKWESASFFETHVKSKACTEFGELMSVAENGPAQIYQCAEII